MVSDARRRSCAQAWSILPYAASLIGFLAIKTQSHPASIRGMRKRTDSLIRRFTRFRTTAGPILRLTEKPKRLYGSSFPSIHNTARRLLKLLPRRRTSRNRSLSRTLKRRLTTVCVHRSLSETLFCARWAERCRPAPSRTSYPFSQPSSRSLPSCTNNLTHAYH